MAKELLKPKLIDTSIFNLKPVEGSDFSSSVREDFHLEYGEGHNVVVVSDGRTDYQKEIESQTKNAGLVNILRYQEMRYGSINNAIVKNEEKKVYADVSHIPDSVGEQAALVAKTNAEVDRICQELGITKEQLLNLTPEKYIEIKQKQADAAASATANAGGGAE